MITIHKHTLVFNDLQVVEMTAEARILDVQVQDNRLQLWEMHRSDCEPYAKINRLIRIIGTGHQATVHPSELLYICTVQHDGLVWHIFEQKV